MAHLAAMDTRGSVRLARGTEPASGACMPAATLGEANSAGRQIGETQVRQRLAVAAIVEHRPSFAGIGQRPHVSSVAKRQISRNMPLPTSRLPFADSAVDDKQGRHSDEAKPERSRLIVPGATKVLGTYSFHPQGSFHASSKDQLDGSGNNDCRIRSHWLGVTSRTSNVCSLSSPRSTPKSIGSRVSSFLSPTSSFISSNRISRSGEFLGR